MGQLNTVLWSRNWHQCSRWGRYTRSFERSSFGQSYPRMTRRFGKWWASMGPECCKLGRSIRRRRCKRSWWNRPSWCSSLRSSKGLVSMELVFRSFHRWRRRRRCKCGNEFEKLIKKIKKKIKKNWFKNFSDLMNLITFHPFKRNIPNKISMVLAQNSAVQTRIRSTWNCNIAIGAGPTRGTYTSVVQIIIGVDTGS